MNQITFDETKWKLVPLEPSSKQVVFMACEIQGADKVLDALLEARGELEQITLSDTGEHYNNPKLNAAIESLQAPQHVEWLGYRPLLADAISAKEAMREAGVPYDTFGIMFPDLMRRFQALAQPNPAIAEIIRKAYMLGEKFGTWFDSDNPSSQHLADQANMEFKALLAEFDKDAPPANEVQVAEGQPHRQRRGGAGNGKTASLM